MKVFLLLTPFLAHLVLNSTLSTTYILKAAQDVHKLSNYVCKVTKNITKSTNDTQDVLIGNLGGKLWSSTVNDIAGCVGREAAVVISDFKEAVTEKTLRKAAVIVLAVGSANKASINTIVAKHMFSTAWNHDARIIFLINNPIDAGTQADIIKKLKFFGIQNFALAYEHQHEVYVTVLDYLKGSATNLAANCTDQDLFYDKLTDLHGYAYRIVVCAQLPRITIKQMKVHSALLYFLQAVAKIQNARLHVKLLNSCRDLTVYWERLLMDLTLNTAVEFHAPSFPKLLTYEESGHCALVPLPPKIPLFQSIFIEPFDGLTWMFFVLTMACSVAVWWMFQDRGAVDSPWLLGYSMFVMFIGQGVDFSRRNRLVLVILLELIIVMVWILSNAYEGVITSFMIQPIQENRLETFDQLVASKYDILTDGAFIYSVNETAAFKELKSRLNKNVYIKWESLRIILEELKKVVILECDQIDLIMTFELPNGVKVLDYYYVLPETLSSYLIRLEASYFNPFIGRLQHYMDLSFQAGLMHIWKVFESPKISYLLHNDVLTYLKLDDLTQVFGILVIGFVLSTAVLLIEVFFCDVLRMLQLANLARILKNRVHQMSYRKRNPKYQTGALYYILHRRKRVKRLKAKKLKLRRIYVQPRFLVD